MVYYENHEGGYAVVAGCGKEEIVVIADTYENVPVREIGPGAFRFRRQIKRVILPPTIRVIGEKAFDFCLELEYIGLDPEEKSDSHLPAAVKVVGERAFCATALRNMTIPATDVSIGKACFMDCFHLEWVAFPHALNLSMGEKVFYNSGMKVFEAPLIQVAEVPADLFGHCELKECIPGELIAQKREFEMGQTELTFYTDKYAAPEEFSDRLEGVFRCLLPQHISFHPTTPETHRNVLMIPCFGNGREILTELLYDLAEMEAAVVVQLERIDEEHFKVLSMEPTEDAQTVYPRLKSMIRQKWEKAGVRDITPKKRPCTAEEILDEFKSFLRRHEA